MSTMSWLSPEQGRGLPLVAGGHPPSSALPFRPAGRFTRLSTCSMNAWRWACRAWSLLLRAATKGRSTRSDSSEIWTTAKTSQRLVKSSRGLDMTSAGEHQPDSETFPGRLARPPRCSRPCGRREGTCGGSWTRGRLTAVWR